MKKKKGLFTNLILLLLVFSLAFSLFSCSGGGVQSSVTESSSAVDDNGESSVPETAPILSKEQAIALIEQDREVIEIFASNSLCENKKAMSAATLSADNKYCSFSAIETLLASTYLPSGGESDFFLSYPTESLPAISNTDGKTTVFCHPGSNYADYIDISTVSVQDTDSETAKNIKATTVGGREVILSAVLENGVWLLEKSLFNSNILELEPLDTNFPLSGKGSLSAFNGNILVIELFISDSNLGFTSEEKSTFHEKISAGVDFLVSESERLGGEVAVTYETIPFEHFGTVGEGDLPFDLVIGETGFGTLEGLAEFHFANLDEYDSYFFAVCFNKECEPLFKVNDGSSTTEFYYGERFFVGTNTTEHDICLSVLNLLGAYGYDSGICDEYTEWLYHTYFTNDVFANTALENSQITPVTAYCCGITDDLDELYRVFIYKSENNTESEEQENVGV